MAKKDEPKKAEPTTALATQGTTEIEVHEGYGEDAGGGRENQGIKDVKIAFLSILQPMSPQCTAQNPHPMAKPGNFFNTVTEEYFDGKVGVVVTPATFKESHVAWKDRNDKSPGGAYLGQYEPNDEVVKVSEANRRKTGEKLSKRKLMQRDDKGAWIETSNRLVETKYMPCVHHLDGGSLRPVMMAFKSTHIKPWRDWNSKTNAVMVKVAEPGGGYHEEAPPLYAFQVRITTEYNKEGEQVWYTPKFEALDGQSYKNGLMTAKAPAFQAAKKLCKDFNAGTADVDYASEGKAAAGGDEELPF